MRNRTLHDVADDLNIKKLRKELCKLIDERLSQFENEFSVQTGGKKYPSFRGEIAGIVKFLDDYRKQFEEKRKDNIFYVAMLFAKLRALNQRVSALGDSSKNNDAQAYHYYLGILAILNKNIKNKFLNQTDDVSFSAEIDSVISSNATVSHDSSTASTSIGIAKRYEDPLKMGLMRIAKRQVEKLGKVTSLFATSSSSSAESSKLKDKSNKDELDYDEEDLLDDDEKTSSSARTSSSASREEAKDFLFNSHDNNKFKFYSNAYETLSDGSIDHTKGTFADMFRD